MNRPSANLADKMTHINYVHEIYPDMNPLELDFVLTQKAVTTTVQPAAAKRHCELGCGYGDTLVLLAAMDPAGEYLGLDANPAHIAAARELAREAGIDNVQFQEMTFAEALQQDQGTFEWIFINHVLSLVPPTAEEQIFAFIDRFLDQNGKVYIDYYCQPGQAQMAPLSRMLNFFYDLTPDDSAEDARCQVAFNQIKDMADRKARIFTQNIRLNNQVNQLSKKPINFIIQQYLAANPHSMPYFLDLAEQLAPLGLDFIGSSRYLRNVDEFQYTRGQLGYLNRFKQPLQREQVADFLRNTGFRNDIFCRHPRHLSRPERLEKWQQVMFGLIKPADDISSELKLPEGTASLDGPLFWSIIQCLQEDPCTLADMEQKTGYSAEEMIKTALHPLLVSGQIKPFRPRTETPEKIKTLNTLLIKRAKKLQPVTALGTAHGICLKIPLLEQIYLLEKTDDFAADMENILGWLQKNNRGVLDGAGRPIQEKNKQLTRLTELLTTLQESKWPLYQALGVL